FFGSQGEVLDDVVDIPRLIHQSFSSRCGFGWSLGIGERLSNWGERPNFSTSQSGEEGFKLILSELPLLTALLNKGLVVYQPAFAPLRLPLETAFVACDSKSISPHLTYEQTSTKRRHPKLCLGVRALEELYSQ